MTLIDKKWQWTPGHEAVLAALERDAEQIPLGRPNFKLACEWLRGALAEIEDLSSSLDAEIAERGRASALHTEAALRWEAERQKLEADIRNLNVERDRLVAEVSGALDSSRLQIEAITRDRRELFEKFDRNIDAHNHIAKERDKFLAERNAEIERSIELKRLSELRGVEICRLGGDPEALDVMLQVAKREALRDLKRRIGDLAPNWAAQNASLGMTEVFDEIDKACEELKP